jgi:type I restriction enzyme S subunit
MGNAWPVEPLADHVELISGQHIEAALCNENGLGYPYLTGPADFPEGEIQVTKFTRFPKVKCRSGDVLVTVKGSGTGKTTLADAPYCISRQLMAVRAVTIAEGYLGHVLASQTDRMRAEASGLIPGISRSDVLSIPFGAVALPEQTKIAEILDTVDDAIRKTEQIIAKLEQLKQGLLHDLLTRGIDENGELRDPERHPEQFKDSELGRIPREWTIKSLEHLATIQSGIAKNSSQSVRNPTLVHYLRVANVQDGYLDLSEMSRIPIAAGDLDRYRVLPGDVLMNEGGDLDKLGRGCVWDGQVDPCVHQNHVFVVRPDTALDSEFLNAWTGSSQAKRYFMRVGKQTTNLASINKTSLGGLPIPVPSPCEQKRSSAFSSKESWKTSSPARSASPRSSKGSANDGEMAVITTGDTVHVPASKLDLTPDVHAMVRTEVLERKSPPGRSIRVEMPVSGEPSKWIATKHAHRNVGVFLLRVGDFQTEMDLLDPLAKSLLQFFRLILPDDDYVRLARVRSGSEIRTMWEMNHQHAIISHVVIIGHGSSDGRIQIGNDWVTSTDLASCFDVAGASPKVFISLACRTGLAAFAREFSRSRCCKAFMAPFETVHGSIASTLCQSYFTHLFLEGLGRRAAFNRIQNYLAGGGRFRFWEGGSLGK